MTPFFKLPKRHAAQKLAVLRLNFFPGGGATDWIKLLRCIAIFFYAGLQYEAGAQIVPEALQCNHLIMEAIVTSDPNCSSQECNRAFFQVRLRTNGAFIPSGGANTPTFYLAYEEISAVIQMTGSDLSSLDKDETKSCFESGSFPQSDYSIYSIEPDTRTVSFQLTNPNENGPVIAFTKLTGQTVWVSNLFVVVMATYPSVSIQPAFLAATYQYGSTKCTYPGSPLSPTYLQTATETYTAPAAPTTLETDVCLQFGTFDTNAKLLPVEIVNSASTSKSVRYLNFTFDVAPTNLMVPPVLTNFIQTPVYQKRIPIPGTNNYRFFVRFAPPANTPIALDPSGGPASKKKLFDVKVEGPQLQTLLTTVQVCFVSGQIRTGNYNSPGDCKAACLSSACANISFGEANYCNPPDFTLRIRGHQTGNCNLQRVTATLGWNAASDPLNFERIKITLKFDLGNGVSIANIGTNSFGCPSSNTTCLPNGTYNNCFSINGDVVSFCFYPSSGINIFKDSGFEIFFNTPAGCVGGVTVTEALVDIAGSAACVPAIDIQGFPLCPPLLAGSIRDEEGDSIDDVKVSISREPTSGSCPNATLVPGNLPFSQCVCDNGAGIVYKVRPSVRFDGQNGNANHYLNGVSTYDLVLISKHILGLELLNSPYKIIAADANKSGGVTTADVTEIRKLILGINSVFPNNAPSWRYIDADFVFPNPADPFSSTFPDVIAVANFPETKADFVAVKVGDVNNTHSDDLAPGKPAAKAGVFDIEYPAEKASAGEYVTLPVVYRGAETLAAFQLGLDFDPARLEWIGPSSGDLAGMNNDCFGLTELGEGKIRVVWLAMEPENYLIEGQTLFSLTFKVLSGGKGDMLQSADAILENLGFRADGATYGLTARAVAPAERLKTAPNEAGVAVACLPNPASGAVTLRLEATSEKRAALSVFSAFGVRKFYKELDLSAGANDLNIPEAANWPAGVYVWKAKFGKNRLQGTFIKQ